ncbi:hypothetical protein ACJX0J_019291 [Zea mays]
MLHKPKANQSINMNMQISYRTCPFLFICDFLLVTFFFHITFGKSIVLIYVNGDRPVIIWGCTATVNGDPPFSTTGHIDNLKFSFEAFIYILIFNFFGRVFLWYMHLYLIDVVSNHLHAIFVISSSSF